MTEEDKIIYGTLLVVTLLVAIFIWWAIRLSRQEDQTSGEITADQVWQASASARLGEDLLWCVWHNRLSAKEFLITVKDARDEVLTVITDYHMVPDGIRSRYEHGGSKRLHMRTALMSSETVLRDAATGQDLLICDHGTMRDVYLAPESRAELFTLQRTSVFHPWHHVLQDGRKIGRLFNVDGLGTHIIGLSVEPGCLTMEEKLFLLCCSAG